MLVSEIATRVKRQFGDEAGAQITDADIMRWVNDAQRDIAVNNDLLQAAASTQMTIGENEYSLPLDVLNIRNVYHDKRMLVSLSNQDSVALNVSDQDTIGDPTHFWVWGLKITVYPTPRTASMLKLYYTKQPTLITNVGQTPDLPQQYHNRIVEYCIAQAYELDDNMESYRAKMQMFQEGMDRLKGNADWQPQDVYPSISVSVADYGDGYHG